MFFGFDWVTALGAILFALFIFGLAHFLWTNRADWRRAFVVIGVAPIIAGAGLLIIAALMLGHDALDWLKTGAWPENTVADYMMKRGLHFPATSWYGIQKILFWIGQQSIALPMFVVGGIACAVGAALMTYLGEWADAADERRRERKLEKEFGRGPAAK